MGFVLKNLFSQDTKFSDSVDNTHFTGLSWLVIQTQKHSTLKESVWIKNSVLICPDGKLVVAKENRPDESQYVQLPFQSATIIATNI